MPFALNKKNRKTKIHTINVDTIDVFIPLFISHSKPFCFQFQDAWDDIEDPIPKM